jgi:hypothetical protein
MLETPDLLLEPEDDGAPYEGVPIGASAPQMGTARTYRVLGLNPREVELVIHDVTWVDGSREVFAPEREVGNHPRFDGIVGRHRLGIQRVGGLAYMVLSQSRLNDTPRASRVFPELGSLQQGAGVPFVNTLLRFGADAVDSREALLGDTGNQRRRQVVTFDPESAPHLPAVVFVLTRVAPIARGVRA